MLRLLSALALLCALPALAQYNKSAGMNAPAAEPVKVERRTGTGDTVVETRFVPPPRDGYGNAQGNQYDLAVDGAFDGQTVLVVDLYGQDFSRAAAAIKEKGFSVVRYQHVPPVKELEEGLAKSNQFWILASCSGQVHLSKEHQLAVKRFFESGHGVYLWGDNDPCNADADALARLLVDASVQGNLYGDQVVGLSKGDGQAGVARRHLLTTGLEFIYEGITVATVKPVGPMTPIVWGSAGNLVTAAYEANGRRLVVDGGYTRLSNKWDTAGTGRYVKNAAAWLANAERFQEVVKR
ncbi:MAG: hypothetical protein AMXMBFR34_20020 [Myxococcaceae bacterium]